MASLGIAIIVVASESRTEQLMVNMRVGVNVSARQQARHGSRQGAMNAVGLGWPAGRARKSSFAPAAKNGSEGKPGSSRGGIIGCGAGSSAGAMPSTGGASTGVSAILMCGGGEADARGREDALQEARRPVDAGRKPRDDSNSTPVAAFCLITSLMT